MTEKERISRWAHLRVDSRSGTVSRDIGKFFRSQVGKVQLAALEKVHSENQPTTADSVNAQKK
jgi:hypothetical protein